MSPEFEKFLEIPAVSILKGTIVIANRGRYESLTIDNKVPDPLDLLEIITENYEKLYITDLNGILNGKPQVEFIHKLSEFAEIWVDAGVVGTENIYDLFIAGAREVILSTKIINGLIEVAKSYELSENLIFQIDYDKGIVSQKSQLRTMKPIELINELRDIGINRVILADLSRIQTEKRLNYNLVRELVRTRSKIFVGGGVKVKDISTLKQAGAKGAILELVDVLKHGKVKL